jgi:hypothetical protein
MMAGAIGPISQIRKRGRPDAESLRPNVFTKPWKMAFGVWKRAPKGYENYEYACHEGNRWNELTSGQEKNTRK